MLTGHIYVNLFMGLFIYFFFMNLFMLNLPQISTSGSIKWAKPRGSRYSIHVESEKPTEACVEALGIFLFPNNSLVAP